MGDIKRYMPQLVTGLPGQRSPVGVAMVEVSDGGCGCVDLPEHERALAAEARWSALEAVARAERDAAVSVSAELREQVSAREAMIARLHLDLSAKDAEIAELRKQMQVETDARCLSDQEHSEAYFRQLKAEEKRDRSAAERDLALWRLDEWIKRAQQAESERDEARECVKRLWPLVNEHTDCLRAEADAALLDRKRRGYLAELAVVEAAIAATPEHLR